MLTTWRRRAVPAGSVLLTLLVSALSAAPASGAPAAGADPATPWRVRHWPQTQPWQRAQPTDRTRPAGTPQPIDPQRYELPDTMTWDDYTPVPGTSWSDPSVSGSVRTFAGALVLVDFPDQPFVVTRPAGSTVYGNPSTVHDLPRSDVPAFYRDLLNRPGPLNRGHTIHEYWMEDSGGRYGIDLRAFGGYRMPARSHEYGIESSMQAGRGCPAGDTCGRDLRADARAAWIADVGTEVAGRYDFVFFLAAGQDESSTWQEFGEMKFAGRDAVTDAFGPPDGTLPNWNATRYVDWTSWQASAGVWPNAANGSSVQAESSGMSTYAHEFSHILGVADNYNNPYSVPARRDYSGPWEMLSRGTFNGPGGPHSRWLIPATAGSSMGAQHMLRNKMKLGILDDDAVLTVSRAALADSGVVVARVTARTVEPGADGLAGVNVTLDGGDGGPACDTAADPYCDGGGYDDYTVEVVDRMGFDSFTPDSGVLLAKTKDRDAAPFIWTVDANPQDIDKVDFVLPDGTPQKMTVGDYRQLSDALFHAGTDSGSRYEYVDAANRLHFYVLERARDAAGVLSYTVAVRSLDGAGPHGRGVALSPSPSASVVAPASAGWSRCTIGVRNTGHTVPAPDGPARDLAAHVGADVYRIAATAGAGWTTWSPRAVVAVAAGATAPADVWVRRATATATATATSTATGTGTATTVTLTVTSESDPAATATTSCRVR